MIMRELTTCFINGLCIGISVSISPQNATAQDVYKAYGAIYCFNNKIYENKLDTERHLLKPAVALYCHI